MNLNWAFGGLKILLRSLSLCLLLACSNSYSFSLGGGGGSPPPPPPPTVAIDAPTTNSTYLTSSSSLGISGTCITYAGYEAQVSWSNNRGGSGSLGFVGYLWSASNVILQPGQNIITVSAYDKYGTGDTSQTTLIATYVPPPKIVINYPSSGQRWSNALFTANGIVSDMTQVAGVYCKLNDSEWFNPTGITNWSAALNLVPGTNILSAYAVDTNGFISSTNSVSFDFVVTNQLKIRVFGLGKIKPNYSNAWLEIGRNYCITSSPASHFISTNWITSTNWAGGVKTNGKKVEFTMESNLTLQASFAEKAIPTLSIKSPSANKTVMSPLIKLSGTAKDTWGVTNVWYQLNGGEWQLATTTNNWKTWAATLQLAVGINKINVYSKNLGGNFSKIKSVTVKSNNTFTLQLGLISGTPVLNDGLHFGLEASPGISGSIQVSTDLVNWQTLTNFVGSNAIINFHDSAAPKYQQRFYRAVTLEP